MREAKKRTAKPIFTEGEETDNTMLASEDVLRDEWENERDEQWNNA